MHVVTYFYQSDLATCNCSRIGRARMYFCNNINCILLTDDVCIPVLLVQEKMMEMEHSVRGASCLVLGEFHTYICHDNNKLYSPSSTELYTKRVLLCSYWHNKRFSHHFTLPARRANCGWYVSDLFTGSCRPFETCTILCTVTGLYLRNGYQPEWIFSQSEQGDTSVTKTDTSVPGVWVQIVSNHL